MDTLPLTKFQPPPEGSLGGGNSLLWINEGSKADGLCVACFIHMVDLPVTCASPRQAELMGLSEIQPGIRVSVDDKHSHQRHSFQGKPRLWPQINCCFFILLTDCIPLGQWFFFFFSPWRGGRWV